MEKLNRERRKKRKLLESISIIMILSGSIFDLVNISLNLNYDIWYDIHYALKDTQMLGICLLCFLLCDYSNLKIKAFTFMLVIWRLLVLPANILTDSPVWWSVVPVYSIYLFWMWRTLRIKDHAPVYVNRELKEYISTVRTYNVLLPVNTFRGLLQSLFTLKNPKYETRLLVHGERIYSVQHDMFTVQLYDESVINDLMSKAGAKIKLIGVPQERKINKVRSLLGKPAIFGIRDCRRLEL